jgi:hypothetical protein
MISMCFKLEISAAESRIYTHIYIYMVNQHHDCRTDDRRLPLSARQCVFKQLQEAMLCLTFVPFSISGDQKICHVPSQICEQRETKTEDPKGKKRSQMITKQGSTNHKRIQTSQESSATQRCPEPLVPQSSQKQHGQLTLVIQR